MDVVASLRSLGWEALAIRQSPRLSHIGDRQLFGGAIFSVDFSKTSTAG
jgi:hypothetical protein